jgi:predicted MFS family arabinose efflux permease
MFWIAGATMFVSAGILYRALPPHRSDSAQGLGYGKLLRSLWELCRDLPDLRKVALNGALMYASLSAFWATIAFYLASDTYRLGPEVAGLFGLVGATGAVSVAFVGRRVERVGPRRVVQLCIGVMLFAYLVFAFFGGKMHGLIAGVILLDMGAQAATVSNQTQIYGFHPEAQSRLNTIYKMFYFSGGAIGSASAALAWQHFHWLGVCVLGIGLLALSWFFETLFHGKSRRDFAIQAAIGRPA